jgi:hypothetical protein
MLFSGAMRAFIVAGVVAALGGQAAADYKDDLKRVEGRLKTTPAGRGVDKAPAGGPGWCNPLTEKPYTGGFEISLDSYYGAPQTKGYALVEAARALCRNDPNEPVIHRAAQEVLQLWMNTYGLSGPDATESLRLTLDKSLNESSKKKLCDALELNAEIGGADRAFMATRRELFDCGGGISSVAGVSPMGALVPWLDSSAKEPDEVVRLAFVSKEVHAIDVATGDFKEKTLLAYAIGQFDFKALDAKKAIAMADVEPYKGNIYARVTIKETLGLTRLAMLNVEDEVKKKTEKDPDWKELIITAPQKGYSGWLAATAQYKAQLQKSAEFEQTAFGPSKKASAGCQKALKPDLVAVLKPLKKETATELVSEMNKSPIAGLLFRRFQACVAVDGDKSAAAEMTKIKGIRVMRGPRAAAYYAVMDALGKIRADRAKFSIEERDIPIERRDILERLTDDLARGHDATAYTVWEGKGVIKAMKKGADGINVVFAKDKQQIWSQTCKQLNRIVMFAADGRPIYDQSCTGKVISADVSPDPINVPEHLAEGLAPGKQVSFGVSNSQAKRISMPFEVYADKQGKKLIAYYGIGL